jgi:hypothetical protein
MKLLILAGWLFLSCVAWNQTNPLPYVKNGVWSLVDTNGRLLKKTDYTYIHQFDEEGYTFFCENGGYGIMNRFGEIVVEPLYSDVQQKGHGHFQLRDKNGWIPFDPKGFQLIGNDTIQSFETLSPTWALTGMKNKWYLEHLQTGNRWPLKDSTVSYQLLHDHLWLIENDSAQLLINGNGKMVLKGKLDVRSQNGLYDIRQLKTHYLFDAHGKWPMDDIEQLTYEESAVFVKTKKAGIYCGYDGSVLLQGNYEEITEFNAQYFQVRRDGLVSLVDRNSGKPVLPFLYDNIFPRLDGGYNVELENNTGLLDSSFKTIVPCNYERFTVEGDLVKVYELSYGGLYSLKTKKEILPPVYNTITRNGNRFKAVRNDLITIIELNDQHSIVKTAKIDNVITVRSLRQLARSVRPKFIDPRLFALGWFLDSTYITPPVESPFYAVKWGLRDVRDSIIIPSSLAELKYIPLAPYTMLQAGSIDFPYGLFPYRRLPNVYPVYLPSGKVLSSLAIIGYDSTDFRRRAFMRASTVKGLGILQEDGKYKSYSYIEKGPNRHLLICEAKSVEITEVKSDEMTEATFLNYAGSAINHPTFERNYLKAKTIKGFIYPEGKWNYLQPNGTPLFDQPFTFAQPFLGNQALVKQGKKWGLVNPDTLIIPAIYSAIERKIVDRDTFFVAQQAQGGFRLLDSASNTLHDYTVFSSRGNVLILEIGGQKQLFDLNLKPLSEAYSSMKFLRNGFILAKTKKEYTLLDTEGGVFYVGANPPENVLCSSFLLYDNGGSFTLRDRSDNIIAEACSSIEAQGNYIIVRKNGKTTVLDLRGTVIVKDIKGSVVVDTLGNYLAVLKKGKTAIYEGTERIQVLKKLAPTHFISGKLIINAKDSCRIYAVSGKQEQIVAAVEAFKTFDDGSVFLKTAGNVNFLFNREWKPILPEELKFRQLTNLGLAIYAYATAEGKTVLYNEETGESDSSFRIGFGRFESDRLLVKNGDRFCYLDTHFKPVTTRTFLQAIPFSGNHAAIADQRGWTLIDHQCNSLTYPNYGAITALNEQVFKTQKLPLYGLYNTQGKLLIPVVYEQLSFLPNGIVLGVKEGAFYYFRKDGSQLPML